MANSPVPTAIQGTTDANPKYSIQGTSNIVARSSPTRSNVDFVRPELTAMYSKYDKVEDCCQGAEAVKARGYAYLPHPDPKDVNAVARYADYLLRATFYNATRHTLEGLGGQVFMRDPIIDLPTACKILEKDCDGTGTSLLQFAKKSVDEVLKFGRGGILADFPNTEGRSTSRQDILNGTVRPTLTLYHPKDIRNWRTKSVRGKIYLTLIVLAERYTAEDDGFKSEEKEQFRVLRLDLPDVGKPRATVQIYREDTEAVELPILDGKGNPLEELPFTFIGAKTNNSDVDYPPLYDLADINLAHYRNSADYEESVFIIGQPTPWASGLTQDWVENVLKGELRIGSRAVIPLPENGACGLMQAEANTLAFEAMKHKEDQMVALGARLVQELQVQKTATQSNHDKSTETSILSTVADNVSEAIKYGLEWCAIFTGEVTQDKDARSKAVKFDINTEFDIVRMDANEQNALIKLWQAEGLTDTEFRDRLRSAGLATEEDTAWKSERDEKMTQAIDQLAQETVASIPPEGNVNGTN